MPTHSFMIEHKNSGKLILFDLGIRKDWWNYAPVNVKSIKKGVSAMNVPNNINEILKEGGVDDKKTSTVIWSHWHFDHCGDMSLFDAKTELVVGPGFKDAMMPGYPKNEESPMLESDFEGRSVREIDFSGDLTVGKYKAFDFYGDGCFFLLHTPGHAIGHMSALARTTHDTFILLGGDVCHFGGVYRPTAYNPLPDPIPSTVPLDKARFQSPCPCAIFTACHRDQQNPRTTPFYLITEKKDGFYVDPPTAQESADALVDFDADPNVLVAIAHDEGLIPVCEWFPESLAPMNDWKVKGWKKKSAWGFLNALPIDGRPAKPWLCQGFSGDGKEVDL